MRGGGVIWAMPESKHSFFMGDRPLLVSGKVELKVAVEDTITYKKNPGVFNLYLL